MDCYRLVGENPLAEAYANEVIRAGTSHLGKELSPMRIAEARVTLGVIAARQDDLDRAIFFGNRALDGERKSLPSLLMVSSELGALMSSRYAKEPEAQGYLDRLQELSFRQ